MYILIAEDDEALRRALSQILEADGHTVCWAATGPATLKHLRVEKPDLLLLDMMLPEIDGWRVLAEKEEDPEICAIPTLCMSGLPADEVRQRGRIVRNVLSGIRLILQKPIPGETLQLAVRRLGELRKMEDA